MPCSLNIGSFPISVSFCSSFLFHQTRISPAFGRSRFVLSNFSPPSVEFAPRYGVLAGRFSLSSLFFPSLCFMYVVAHLLR
ncbi:hypothetical protein BOTBODRAFT_501688 [Botryobasidium botryosum FD-172 SS1]|uniref:Uncharacterized protein n=1 Tax=Botryobasidium botryosum (strain FD-172 SS1) TaxID=930990 RepID=A0A067M5X9_BOTB1|nr:hypothetical protein BOTBODRAFT_501688 [Botryobasidium botryosum FD-172 SS1]